MCEQLNKLELTGWDIERRDIETLLTPRKKIRRHFLLVLNKVKTLSLSSLHRIKQQCPDHVTLRMTTVKTEERIPIVFEEMYDVDLQKVSVDMLN